METVYNFYGWFLYNILIFERKFLMFDDFK